MFLKNVSLTEKWNVSKQEIFYFLGALNTSSTLNFSYQVTNVQAKILNTIPICEICVTKDYVMWCKEKWTLGQKRNQKIVTKFAHCTRIQWPITLTISDSKSTHTVPRYKE